MQKERQPLVQGRSVGVLDRLPLSKMHTALLLLGLLCGGGVIFMVKMHHEEPAEVSADAAPVVKAEEAVTAASPASKEDAVADASPAAKEDAAVASPAAKTVATPAGNPTALIKTSMGEIRAEIFLKEMPITASNFIDLCKTGFYDGTRFHRVIKNFMIQLGDPYSKVASFVARWGQGGPQPHSKFDVLDPNGKHVQTKTRNGQGSIEDEFAAEISNDIGTLAMANSGAQSGGSQFFINVKHNTHLDWFDHSSPAKHPVFGKVQGNGMHVANAISTTDTNEHDRPLKAIVFQSCKVEGM